MASQVNNYQCPSCTGPIKFSSALGKLECEYCGSVYEVAEIEALYAQKEQKATAAFDKEQEKQQGATATIEDIDGDTIEHSGEWTSEGSMDWGEDGEGMKSYSCPSCAAELICDATTAATSCPYCGNPTVVPGQFGGMLKPDYVIPFEKDKQSAIDTLKKFYKGKFLLPKSFKSENHIEEIKGVYVPVWLFSGVADADATYNATDSSSHRSGDYIITTTKHYKVRRAGTMGFENIPVDGSTKMPDAHMESIEPFNYNDLKPFSTAYLPGFLADKYDVDSQRTAERADKRAESTVLDLLQRSVTGYDTAHRSGARVNIQKGQVKYCLAPVWMLATKWQDKNFLFAMNGQTGKLIGDLPCDMKKFWLTFAAVAAAVGGIGSFLVSLGIFM